MRQFRSKMAVVIFIITIFVACDSVPEQKVPKANNAELFKNMHWLVGTWQGTYKDAPFYEAWRKINDTLLENYSIEIGTDTVIKPGSPLNVFDGKIFLGKKDSTHWELIEASANRIQLKNDTIRFSNTIDWRHTADDHWITVLKTKK